MRSQPHGRLLHLSSALPAVNGTLWGSHWRVASFSLATGASPRTVVKTLGHSQIALTMNPYAHVLLEIERAAMDGAAEAIFGAGSAGTDKAP